MNNNNDAEPKARRLLIVDDDIDVCESMAFVLKKLPFEIRMAHSGREALELAVNWPPDVMATDIRMPGMSGVDLIEAMSRLHPNVCVVALSAHGDVDVAVASMKLGAVEFLRKPVQNDVLRHAVEMASERWRLRNELKTANEELSRQVEARSLAEAHEKRISEGLRSLVDALPGLLMTSDGADEVLSRSVTVVENVLGASSCAVALLKSNDALEVVASSIAGLSFGHFISGELSEALRRKVAMSRRGWILLDEIPASIEFPDFKSINVATPIHSGGRLAGFLLCHLQNGDMDGAMKDVLPVFCSMLGDALRYMESERKAQDTEKLYVELFNLGQLGIAVLAPGTSIVTDCNPRFREMLKLGGESCGVSLEGLSHRDDAETLHAKLEELRSRRVEEVSFDHCLYCGDGCPLGVLLSLKLMPSSSDGVSGRVACVLHDISDQKRAEALRDDIERITRHDLKTPLNGILGVPELLRMSGPLTPEQDELLRVIEDSGEKMLRMINLSMNLYKMETGAFERNPVPIEVAGLIRTIARDIADTLDAIGASLRMEINGNPAADSDSFLCLCEELPCYSMLSNLILNAVEASLRGGQVVVSMSSDGASVRISIHNAGVVPEQIRSRFFEKYATFGKPNGTGLGTYSAMLIAQSFGGSISMSTSEEAGTTLTVRLPAARLDSQDTGCA